MPKVTISHAARLAGISRQQLYDGYIRSGKISVERDNPKKPKIDTAEIIRVFGTLQDDRRRADTTLQDITPAKAEVYSSDLNETVRELTTRVSTLELEKAVMNKEVELLRDQNAELKKDRDEWRNQAQTLLLTAAREETQKPPGGLWQWLTGRKAS